MVSFINKDSLELQASQQVDRLGHSNKSLGTKVDLLVVSLTHFAEAWKVWSELVQQGQERHDDQNLFKCTTAAIFFRSP